MMHEAARQVLDAYASTGEPFALFLSSWAFDEARGILHELAGDPREVNIRIQVERQVRALLRLKGLETVAVCRSHDEEQVVSPEAWPSLTLRQDTWRNDIERIASQADLIVVFCGLTTPGMTEELVICDKDANRFKTVVIVNLTATEVWLHQLHKVFPRVAPLGEIRPHELSVMHVELTPLISRMKAIQQAGPKIRAASIGAAARLKRFPLPPLSGRFDQAVWVGS